MERSPTTRTRALCVGVDGFKIDRFSVDGQRESVNITVHVKASGDESSSSSSNGLYALSLLVLVPIVVGAVLFRQQLGCRKTAGGNGNSESRDVSASANAVHHPRQAYLPIQEDQVHREQQARRPNAVTVENMIVTAAAPTQIAVRHPQDPPEARMIQDQARTPNETLPDYKDQCRPVARGNVPHEPPFALVVLADEVHDKESHMKLPV